MSPSILPDRASQPKPSLPAQTTGGTTLDDLPVLTEIVTEQNNPLPRVFSPEEIQLLLPQLEAHIQALFTQKLGLHLEQLQQQAIAQAITELKADLPELLQNSLNAYLNSR